MLCNILVYVILTMASMAGHEKLNSDVGGSIPVVIPLKKKKKKKNRGNISCSRFCKISENAQATMRAMPPLLSDSSTDRQSSLRLDTPNLIEVPDITWKICQVACARMWWNRV